MYSKLIVRSLAAAAVMMTAGSAMAVDLYGGGATFPAVPYVGDSYLDPATDARLSTNAANSLLAAPAGVYPAGHPSAGAAASWAGLGESSPGLNSVFLGYSNASGNKVSYCQTGSGFGKQMLNSNGAGGSCLDFSASPAGLSGASTTPDFIGTDSPYSTGDYNTFLGGPNAAAKQGITQLPTMVGAIALTYDGNGTALLPLTTAQVCQIYAGQITNWANIPGSGLSGPIKIVYRSDNSGTTFAFTSFLASKCGGVVAVTPNQGFVAAFGGSLPAYAATAAVSGNNNVVNTAKAAGGLGLGYADFGEVANQGSKFARVDTFSPAAFGDTNADGVTDRISLAGTDLVRGQVLNGATLAAVPTVPTAIANCTFVVRPTATISNRYPIAAVTYVATYARGNAQSAAVKGLLNAFLAHPNLPVGFAYMDGNATHFTLINNAVNGTTNNCVQ
ncbi:PstS family phosphate ABC transporter substrate-binding protein [Lysobacter changpingensis]|uniref:PstS family phosphate ABC transporter substrate-binding protein n=1 Tax=Lysobacter changpingensis TaxID=2792784 RepID=UPI001A8DDE57|nr:substrate-binding domain-containing protein [Lysobacter changpingensis]